MSTPEERKQRAKDDMAKRLAAENAKRLAEDAAWAAARSKKKAKRGGWVSGIGGLYRDASLRFVAMLVTS